jgi:hypothetical protein
MCHIGTLPPPHEPRLCAPPRLLSRFCALIRPNQRQISAHHRLSCAHLQHISANVQPMCAILRLRSAFVPPIIENELLHMETQPHIFDVLQQSCAARRLNSAVDQWNNAADLRISLDDPQKSAARQPIASADQQCSEVGLGRIHVRRSAPEFLSAGLESATLGSANGRAGRTNRRAARTNGCAERTSRTAGGTNDRAGDTNGHHVRANGFAGGSDDDPECANGASGSAAYTNGRRTTARADPSVKWCGESQMLHS